MVERLTDDAVEQYKRDGILFPIRVFDEATAAELRGKVEALAKAEGG